jgi:DNA polymerase-3 subunit beta
MEFVIHKSELVRELQTVTGVVERRATLPILANLLLETTPEGLQVGASDMEVTIRGMARATVVRPGSITLPAAKLHDIAKSLPDAEVQFKLLERNHMSISCERTRYRIAGQGRDEFPAFPEPDLKSGVQLPALALKRMIDRVLFAITTEDPRYSLNGALLILETGRITLVATDGHRLAYVSRASDVKMPGGELRVIIPRKALHEVAKIVAEEGPEAEVVFGKSEKQIFFAVGQHKLTANLIEGRFPRYENVMPPSSATTLVLPTDELTQAVKRVSLVAHERFGRAVRVQLSKGKLELSSKTEVGEAQESMVADYTGDEVAIGFNARYLLDFLAVVGTTHVRLELNPAPAAASGEEREAGDKPGQLRPEGESEFDYRYVVMPMHL